MESSPEVEAEPITPEIVERRDRTLRGKTFKTWLRDHREEERYVELEEVINFHPKFKGGQFLRLDFDKWCDVLIDIGRPELVEPLLYAVTEWQADGLSRRKGAAALGVSEALVVAGKSGRAKTLSAEIPAEIVQCGWKDRRGSQCKSPSLPGALRCIEHGGTWLDESIRARLLLAAYMRLVEGAEIAVDALLDVVANGKREEARVMAAREILDRAGIRPGIDINVNVNNQPAIEANQLSELRAKLDAMAEGMESRNRLEDEMRARRASEEAEIEDAVVVVEDSNESISS